MAASEIFSEVVRTKGLPIKERVYYYSQWINALIGAKCWGDAERIVKRALRKFPTEEMLQHYRKELTQKTRG
jgi:hypothetical protein